MAQSNTTGPDGRKRPENITITVVRPVMLPHATVVDGQAVTELRRVEYGRSVTVPYDVGLEVIASRKAIEGKHTAAQLVAEGYSDPVEAMQAGEQMQRDRMSVIAEAAGRAAAEAVTAAMGPLIDAAVAAAMGKAAPAGKPAA